MGTLFPFTESQPEEPEEGRKKAGRDLSVIDFFDFFVASWFKLVIKF
jgi:hypothetical protein